MTDGYNSGAAWANAEVREYTFQLDEEDDYQGEAFLVPVKQVAKKGTEEKTSSEVAGSHPNN